MYIVIDVGMWQVETSHDTYEEALRVANNLILDYPNIVITKVVARAKTVMVEE